MVLVESSGNVFADLGLNNADELMAKARLAAQIALLIAERGLTRKQAAKILGIDQPEVSALMHGKFAGFSIDRLQGLLLTLGQDIGIGVRSDGLRNRRLG